MISDEAVEAAKTKVVSCPICDWELEYADNPAFTDLREVARERGREHVIAEHRSHP